jgi:hypothetical protein
VLGPPAGLENGDSFTDRSPPQARQEEAGREGKGGRKEGVETTLLYSKRIPNQGGLGKIDGDDFLGNFLSCWVYVLTIFHFSSKIPL